MTNIGGSSPINATAIGAIAADSKKTTKDVASAVMGAVSGRVAGSISNALRLIGDEEDQHQSGGGQQDDPYAIEELVSALTDEIAGTAAATGYVSRCLHEFAQEAAALIAARPESRSLAYLQSLVAGQDGGTGEANMTDLAAAIANTTAKLRDTRV